VERAGQAVRVEGKVLAAGDGPSQERAREVVTMDTLVGADAGPEDRKPRRKARRPRQDGAAAGGGAVYGIGMIGALVYFLQAAESGWDRVLAFPKAIVWPALLVYRLFRSLDQ
jgi:hypothetical protein